MNSLCFNLWALLFHENSSIQVAIVAMHPLAWRPCGGKAIWSRRFGAARKCVAAPVRIGRSIAPSSPPAPPPPPPRRLTRYLQHLMCRRRRSVLSSTVASSVLTAHLCACVWVQPDPVFASRRLSSKRGADSAVSRAPTVTVVANSATVALVLRFEHPWVTQAIVHRVEDGGGEERENGKRGRWSVFRGITIWGIAWNEYSLIFVCS